MTVNEIIRAITKAQELKLHSIKYVLEIMNNEFPNLASCGLFNHVSSIDDLITRLKSKLNELKSKMAMNNECKKSISIRHR